MLFVARRGDSLGDLCKIAKRGYGLHQTISFWNPTRFCKTLINVNVRGSLNKIYEPGPKPGTIFGLQLDKVIFEGI